MNHLVLHGILALLLAVGLNVGSLASLHVFCHADAPHTEKAMPCHGEASAEHAAINDGSMEDCCKDSAFCPVCVSMNISLDGIAAPAFLAVERTDAGDDIPMLSGQSPMTPQRPPNVLG